MTQTRFKITYATMSIPNPEVDRLYDAAVARARTAPVIARPMFIGGTERYGVHTFATISPVDLDLTLGTFYQGSAADVADAVAAAKGAWDGWRHTPWQERVALLRKAADLISDRVFDIAAIVSLEVGKNRLEALGDVEESADLIRYCCDAMEQNNGFEHPLLNENERAQNRSVLKPYGVWGVISPFNFPAALSAGPTGAALVTGNTVVHKPAEDTPYSSWLIGQCFVDAGLPAGVFNQVTGDELPGKALVAHPDVAGLTFTGSYGVGMSILRQFATGGKYAKPIVLEMGGKNPTIITPNADLDKAVPGVLRSAFGLSGQKCSACSRVYVHESIREPFTERLVAAAAALAVGDPTEKGNYMGPVINKAAYDNYRRWTRELGEQGRIAHGGQTIEQNGYYVLPTIVTDLPEDSAYWKQELFLPIVKIAGYESADEAMAKANDVDFGLTAGFFSEDESEVAWFLDNIEAGVLYVNRPTGATTGAWPGYQSFGGWKGSTGTGKAAGSFYYLQQYMREQSHTLIR